MKKCFINGILTFTIACNFANAAVTPSKADYDKFYHAVDYAVPTILNSLVYTYSFQQTIANAYGKSKIAPYALDPTVSSCLQTALEDKFYQPALKSAINDYLKSASPSEFHQDLGQFLDKDNVKVYRNFQDIFRLYSQSKTFDENIKILDKKEQMISKSKNQPIIAIKNFTHTINENSQFYQALNQQIQQCQKLQEVTP